MAGQKSTASNDDWFWTAGEIALIIGGLIGAMIYLWPSVRAATQPPPPPPINYGTLVVTQSFGDILGPEPDGSYIVTLGVDTMGGELPLTYTLTWSDGYTQTGNGTFQRDFPGYPNSLQGTVSVVSTDGQHASVSVTAPFTPG